MARKLQIIGEFPSGTAPDEEVIKQIVDKYLADNPPTSNVIINGEGSDEATKAVLSVCATVGSKLSNLVIKEGQLIFIPDKHKIALDFDGKRTFYNQIEELSTDDARTSLLEPVEGLFYFVIDTAVLWTYRNGWVQVTTPPKEVIFVGTELPELGANKTLYIDTANKEISIWDEAIGAYIVVADKTEEITADDINALFQKK